MVGSLTAPAIIALMESMTRAIFTTRSYGRRFAMPRSYSRKTRSSQYPPRVCPALCGHLSLPETDIGHAQRNQPRSHLLLHFTGSGSTRLGEDGSRFFTLLYKASQRAFSSSMLVGRSDGGEFGGVFIRQRQKFTDSGNAVLLLERINQVQTFVHFIQTFGVELYFIPLPDTSCEISFNSI